MSRESNQILRRRPTEGLDSVGILDVKGGCKQRRIIGLGLELAGGQAKQDENKEDGRWWSHRVRIEKLNRFDTVELYTLGRCLPSILFTGPTMKLRATQLLVSSTPPHMA